MRGSLEAMRVNLAQLQAVAGLCLCGRLLERRRGGSAASDDGATEYLWNSAVCFRHQSAEGLTTQREDAQGSRAEHCERNLALVVSKQPASRQLQNGLPHILLECEILA